MLKTTRNGPYFLLSRLQRLLLFLIYFYSLNCASTPYALPPDNGLKPEELGIVINDNDPLSVQIGNYYRQRRNIPAENVVHLNFSIKSSEISPGEFAVQKKLLDKRLPARVQALALSWTTPYRVGCMSITSAFAFGFDVRYCATGCVTTEVSDYFNSSHTKPFNSLKIRPAMMLAARDLQAASALIERGIAADGSLPEGAAYLLETSDNARSTRKIFFTEVQLTFGNQLPVHVLKADTLKNARDVMFYFTGLVQVPDIETNRFLPGAIADHLTSYGGRLTDSTQMSALRWLELGATGSYGTVVEPCAFRSKFPNPIPLMEHYLAGETLIEAYWKSVEMPGQGVFIGEPLARPYAAYHVQQHNNRWYVEGPALRPGNYTLFGADKIDGPFEHIASGLQVSGLTRSLELPMPLRNFYKLHYIDMGINLIPASP
ncbi:MAG: TIGR03790 family protein [Spongiibacteraceae bacterium]